MIARQNACKTALPERGCDVSTYRNEWIQRFVFIYSWSGSVLDKESEIQNLGTYWLELLSTKL
jgi:hypothetical protein